MRAPVSARRSSPTPAHNKPIPNPLVGTAFPGPSTSRRLTLRLGSELPGSITGVPPGPAPPQESRRFPRSGTHPAASSRSFRSIRSPVGEPGLIRMSVEPQTTTTLQNSFWSSPHRRRCKHRGVDTSEFAEVPFHNRLLQSIASGWGNRLSVSTQPIA